MLGAFVAGKKPKGKHAEVEVGACAACHFSHDPRWPQVGGSRGHRIHYEEKKIACVRCHAASMHGFEPVATKCEECHGEHAVSVERMHALHCFACHEFLTNEPGLRPTRRDCLRCHTRQGIHAPMKDHGAPMEMACAACHKPHAKDGQTLVACTECHAPAQMAKGGLHARAGHRHCLDCHQPHVWTPEKDSCLRCHARRARARARGRPAPSATRSRARRSRRSRSPRGDPVTAVTLRLKLFVLIAGVIIFAMSGVTAVALWREVQRGQELLRREGVALAATAAGAASRWVRADGLEPGGAEALPPVLERLTRSGAARPGLGGGPERQGRSPAARAPARPARRARRPPSSGRPTCRCRRSGGSSSPEGIVASAPVLREGDVVGAVLVEFTHEEVVGNARDLAWGASLVAVFWIVVGHVLAAIFIRQVTRPLVRLSEAAESLAEERGVRLEQPEDRELADLVRAFNHMSARLEERRAENQRLIAELEERVAQKTREVLRADRLATLGGIAAGFAHEIGNSLNVIRGYASVAVARAARRTRP